MCFSFVSLQQNYFTTKMKLIKNSSFGGERPLFGIQDTRLEGVTITEGESGIKCCKNIMADGCRFIGKYPWWHVDGSVITNCFFEVGSRSAIWYSNDMVMKDTVIDAPKLFREMNRVELENVQFNDADETFWRIKDLKVKNVRLHDGTYPFMEERPSARRHLSVYVLRECLCGGFGERFEIRVPILQERRGPPCKDNHQGLFLGVRERGNLRFRARRGVSGMAFQERAAGALPYQGRAAAVLCGGTRVGELHFRRGVRPHV